MKLAKARLYEKGQSDWQDITDVETHTWGITYTMDGGGSLWLLPWHRIMDVIEVKDE